MEPTSENQPAGRNAGELKALGQQPASDILGRPINDGALTEDETAAGLTVDEKERGISVAEKQRMADLSTAHAVNPDPQHTADNTADLKARHERHRAKEDRDLHLLQNPHHRTAVDNNPVKVPVLVNRISHSVPPGPLKVSDFKRITKLTGSDVSMDGRTLVDDNEEISLEGGEEFTSA